MVFQDRGGLGFLGREDAAGHGVGDDGQRLYQIGGRSSRTGRPRQGGAIRSSTSRAVVMSPPLAAVTTALTTSSPDNHPLDDAGGAVPGAELHAGRFAAIA
jgi:hypothetical protein